MRCLKLQKLSYPKSNKLYNDLELWLKHLRLSSYQFQLKALDNIQLPSYAGSTLRGAFGWAFRHVSCTRIKGECKTCLLQKTCAYASIFETPGDISDRNLIDSQAPRPFILKLPLHDKQMYLPGENLTFGITLLGRAIDYIPYFILAFDEVGQRGLGKGRGRFILESVHQVEPSVVDPIYTAESGKIIIQNSTDGLSIIRDIPNIEDISNLLELEFLTPGRFVQGGQLVNILTFEVLIRSLLRRVTWLGHHHCNINLNINYHELIEKTKNVTIYENNLQWFDWDRYSQRQHTKMKLGGLIGKVSFKGNWKEFVWLINLGELFHVGKGATFGLGSYLIRVIA